MDTWTYETEMNTCIRVTLIFDLRFKCRFPSFYQSVIQLFIKELYEKIANHTGFVLDCSLGRQAKDSTKKYVWLTSLGMFMAFFFLNVFKAMFYGYKI